MFLIFCLLLTSCSFGQEADHFKVGVILPLTGKGAEYGQTARDGIELAVDRYKQEGVNIELIWEDDSFEPKKSVSAYKKLVELDNVDAILGPIGSSNVLAVAPLADEDEVVLVSPVAGASSVTLKHPFVYRTMIKKENQMINLIDHLKEKDYKRVLAISAQNDSPLDAFSILNKGVGGSLENILVPQDEKDFKVYINQIKEKDPDALFVNLFLAQFANFFKQYKELGMSDIDLYASIVFQNKDEIELSKNYIDKIIFVANSEAVAWFKKLHRDFYDKDPGISAANAYDALMVLVEANRISNDLREGIKKLGRIEGALGSYSFDKYGDIDLLSPLMKLESGMISNVD